VFGLLGSLLGWLSGLPWLSIATLFFVYGALTIAWATFRRVMDLTVTVTERLDDITERLGRLEGAVRNESADEDEAL